MCGEQKTKQGKPEVGCPAGERVEPQEPPEARSIETPETMDGDSADERKPGGGLLERMLGTENMFTACERVVRNGGAAGTSRNPCGG
jgi:hypothetical protein